MDTMLVINVNPEVEDDLLDYLLGFDTISGFTSYPVRGHGRHDGRMSLAEQVRGSRRRFVVEVLLDADLVPAVLDGLAGRVGRDITYWQQPVRGFGRIE